MSEQRKAVIKNADMTEDMQQDAVDIASQALAKYNIEKVRTFWLLQLVVVLNWGCSLNLVEERIGKWSCQFEV